MRPAPGPKPAWGTALRRVPGIVVCLALALVSPGNAARADDLPAWARAPAGEASSYGRNVPGVWLLREQEATLSEDGRLTRTERGALRVFSKEGRSQAVAACVYRTDGGRVQRLRGWLIRPSGEAVDLGKKHIADAALVANDVYNEVRVRLLTAGDDAEPGSVFAYEWILEDRSVFTQLDRSFQSRLPVLVSRFSLTLPRGWRAEAVTFNHAPIVGAASGPTTVWELRGLPYLEEEPASPPVSHLVPRLAVSWSPPPGSTAPVRSFASWSDVASWIAELSDPVAQGGEALAAKARALTSGATDELDRIRALGRFVQSVNYISIQTGLGRGGGYRPHAPDDVLAKFYGDCKDKANLMRAMLRAVGIPAWLTAIYSGDAAYVREEWPTPQQFNHCIIAIGVGEGTQASTVIEHPALGRLLVFDPTDPYTPVGDLPESEQGSLALIVDGTRGALLRMPVTPPERNLLEREADVTLDPNGTIQARVRERSTGQAAARQRATHAGADRSEYLGIIERWVARGATTASVTKVEPADDPAGGRFTLDVEFNAPRYGQLIAGRLLSFRPTVVERRDRLFLTEPMRTLPVELFPYASTEVVRVALPEGFVAGDLPAPVRLDADFGRYEATHEVAGRELVFRRSLRLTGGTLPAERYAEVRSFYESIRAAEQAAVVLSRP